MNSETRQATIIHEFGPEGIGEPMAVEPLEYNSSRLRYVYEKPMIQGQQVLIWSRHMGKTLTWLLYTVSGSEPREDGKHIVTARPSGVLRQDVTAMSA